MILASASALRPAPRLRPWSGLLALLVTLFAFVTMADAATPKFPPLSGRVVDQAHILSPAAAQRLDGELATLEQQTGHQLVVATVPDLQGYEIEDYGYQLGRAWALGRKGVNDGAILLVAPSQHKVRIEVGYGLEPVLTDALTSSILQRKVLPQFRQGHMEQGVIDGAEAVIGQLALPEDQAKVKVAEAEAQPPVRVHDRSAGPHVPVIIVILILFWVISSLLRMGGRRGGGGLWWLPFLFMGGGRGGWGDNGGGWGGGSGGGGGFSGGGGSFGGGGSSGSW